ncbi:MAG TPA: 3-phosphoshikimate 1-carboxyvinyltransferase [Vicinamibacterales bacterium]
MTSRISVTVALRRSLSLRPVSAVRGTLAVPGDKSISHRYVMLGALPAGTTTITNLAPGADVASTVACMAALGARVEPRASHALAITGCGTGGFIQPGAPLDAGNSGTTLRLLAGLVAGRPIQTTLTGDASLRRRPMQRIIDPLSAMGARISSAGGRAPLVIEGGGLEAIDWRPPVASAQVKSAILLAGLHARGTTVVREPLLTRDHTERAFPAFGLRVGTEGTNAAVPGGQTAVAPAFPLSVPGDPSSAAVWAAAAAAFQRSSVRIEGVCLTPRRLGFLRALERMGARINIEITGQAAGEPVGDLEVVHSDHLPTVIGADEVPSLIDELPVLAARAALGGALEVSGAGELRVKESDRITALVTGLRAMGVPADERPDGFVVDGHVRPTGGQVDAAGDHRLVMAFALVALGASGPSVITGAEAVGVSYPSFEQDLARLAQ